MSAGPTPRGVSVVIPTLDREAALARALARVAVAARRVEEPVEAIVVDDSPHPGAARPVQWSVDGLPVRRLRTADHGVRGPAAARNLGATAAAYDLIAFTDDDARCDERWLQAGVARLRADAAIAGVEGAVRVDLDMPIDPVRSRVVMNARGGGYLTASLFARAEAVRAIGGFRRMRFDDGDAWAVPYREDTDFGLRLVSRIGPVPFAPEAVVRHPPEAVDLRRLICLARYYVVDGAFARLHPGAVPSLHRAPLARLRIRAATAITLLVPLLAARRTRTPAALGILVLTAAVSGQVELELRTAGLDRSLTDALRDSARRLPRSLVWSLAAGSARLQGEVLVTLGAVALPND
jgi:GT2 family glycosyltransferase